jgi:hypothetical protein
MAFDQSTRNRLQRFVNDARRVLEDEFARQLQNDYGLDPNSGAVTELASLRHINDAQRESARILRDTLAHYCAGGDTDAKQGLGRIVREQAFTVLNRLAALRMAEARGLLVESVGNGFQAKGFQLYARLAGTGLGETGDAYRTYLFSVFDELSRDLPGLFDRYSPQGRLFPREAALLQVLNLINDADVAPLWSEDETIGWIYQYFNSKEERKAMREASQAPRNSRELAVRNQFFTPRYVVEFLVDNTLGRLWFNATGGHTHLRDRCHYLLVKPTEASQAATKLRDPRTLKLLDPACGSMHFGLYAFDLFAEIYREAWGWEQERGAGSLDVSTQPQAALKPLHQTYEDQGAFLRDVPRLIIEHNIYGVDIDSRAAQIASLALWLRAQRAWHDAGVKAKDRPLIGRGHVVAATAPPAERELRQQFAANLDKLDAELFEKTLQLLKWLPELGVLLQVERELPHLIRQVYVGKGTGLFARQEQESWQQAEVRLRKALTEFAQAAKSTYQGRLFAQDALEGLRIIDLCRTAFDVVVMNPPFGAPTASTYTTIRDCYRGSHNDIYASFVARATELAPNGYVGCISSRSFLLSPRLEHYRVNIVLSRLSVLADLGWGVMDDALVEAAAYVLHGNGSDSFKALDLRKQPGARDVLLAASKSNENAIVCMKSWFAALPQGKLLYSAPSEVRELLSDPVQFEPTGGTAREGMKSFDNFRFIRLSWEIPADSVGVGNKWTPFNKGGEFSFFCSDFHLLLNWSKDGAELRQINLAMNGSTAQVRQASDYWYRPGVTYSKRSSRGFSARALPAGMIFTSNGPAILPEQDISPEYLLGWVNSKAIRAIIHLQSNASDYSTGALKRLPWRAPTRRAQEKVKDCVSAAIRSIIAYKSRANETSSWFIAPALTGDVPTSFHELQRLRLLAEQSTALALDETSTEISEIYGVGDTAWADDILEKGSDSEDEGTVEEDSDDEAEESISTEFLRGSILSYGVGVAFGRFDVRQAAVGAHALFAPKPFDPLPKKAPGMLSDGAEPFHAHAGVLVDDQGHTHDLARLVEEVLARVDMTVPDDVRRWLQRDFFAIHLQRYSKSRRKAPIYWPLVTTSGSYTLWIYYPSLSSQTLYTAINDFVEPKLQQVGADVAALRIKGSARTRDDEKQFEVLQAFELELIELRDTLLRIAPSYKPNHNDGVQICAAPLWQLFRNKPWQKVLKDTLAKLEKGDYDWAHLAMDYWPERVREKCRTDKSLAIAHGLEHLYDEPDAQAKKAGGRKKAGGDE